ncbi:hypothetical protein WJX79_009938 [Trebouxia sp. C0005]
MWEQSPTVLSDQSWSKVDGKKERRNYELPTQPDSHLSRFQPMPQSLHNDDVFTPAPDWLNQSERDPWSLSKFSLPPAPCPDQEAATALQSPEHEIASALRDLFGQLYSMEQDQHPHQPVDPTFLRHTLAGLPGAKFQVGEMSDAGEW